MENQDILTSESCEMYENFAKSSDVIELKALIEAYLFSNKSWITMKDLHERFNDYAKEKVELTVIYLYDDYMNRDGALRIYTYSTDTDTYYMMGLKNETISYPEIEKFSAGESFKPLTLKVLAFIAFNQPVEKEDIVCFIGKSAPSRLKLLIKEGFIASTSVSYEILNKKGQPEIMKTKEYATTKFFADYLGVDNNPDLIREKLSEFLT